MRTWTRPLYDIEFGPPLYLMQYSPLVDLGQAVAFISYLQRTDYWRQDVMPENPSAPVRLEWAKTWPEMAGVRERRVRRVGKEFIITVGMGLLSAGFVIHEMSHVPVYRLSGHGDKYLKNWLTLWERNCRASMFKAICDELRRRGVTVP